MLMWPNKHSHRNKVRLYTLPFRHSKRSTRLGHRVQQGQNICGSLPHSKQQQQRWMSITRRRHTPLHIYWRCVRCHLFFKIYSDVCDFSTQSHREDGIFQEALAGRSTQRRAFCCRRSGLVVAFFPHQADLNVLLVQNPLL